MSVNGTGAVKLLGSKGILSGDEKLKAQSNISFDESILNAKKRNVDLSPVTVFAHTQPFAHTQMGSACLK